MIGWTYTALAIGGIFAYIYIQKAVLVLISLIVLFVDGTFYFVACLGASRRYDDNDNVFGAGASARGPAYDNGPSDNPFAASNNDDDDYI